MKKHYFFVVLFFAVCILSLNTTQAQNGFETYDEGITPDFISGMGVSGGGFIKVTTEDQWTGEKSLVISKDALSPLWEPYFTVNLKYTLTTTATLSFCAKVPDTGWLHFAIEDSNGVQGPEFVFYGEWAVFAQHFHPGAVPTTEGDNMAFPIDEWFKFEMTMKVGDAFDETCTLKITELEGLKRTYSNTAFKFSGRPGAASKFNGSLEKATLLMASDRNTPNTEDSKVYIDELLIPSNTPITNVALMGDKMSDCTIYPNPTNGYIRVNSPSSIDLVQILNLEGKVVYEKQNVQGNQQLDISKLSKGMYAVKLVSGKEQVTQKLIVDK